ncbi:ionotropic receptor 25a-like [Harmonia axyridis]|uniref:ionotropic receptor 25a-like n=1 Tax=Harmonia axyridis TaxID=115357 RepID=UPI001E27782D|nr:ionotropic receptor 25a-like [Harmonia axyridis]
MKFLLVLFYIASSYNAQDSQKIFVLYVNEKDNTIAEKGVEVALAYIKDNPKLGVEVDLTTILSNRTDAVELLDPLCKTYDDMVKASKPPHLVFDTTVTGLSSETVKSVTAALGLPTITASYGQDGDLVKWRKIDDDEKKYFIQINPPTDIIPQIIREIVERQNITNAAIMYDNNFVMGHKYKTLLQNIATRNIITAIDKNKLETQIQKLSKMEILNFFILGSLVTIKDVLTLASRNSLLVKTFAWHAITVDEGDITCDCSEGRVLFIKPVIDPMFEERIKQIKKTYQFDNAPLITTIFYFDLALQSFLTIKTMLQKGQWPESMNEYLTCDGFNGTNNPKRTDLDLLTAFRKENTESPTYGPFAVISNGKSSIQFLMEIFLTSFSRNMVESSVSIGTWDASFGSNLTLSKPEMMDNFTSAQIYRVVVVEQKPFIFKDPRHPKGYNGYCIDMMEMIAQNLGFDYVVHIASGNTFGQMDDQGKWNGMVKDIMEKKADIGLGSISIMAERESVIDFTVPYYDLVGYSIMMKSSYVPPSLFKFLSVLEDEVWICILAAYFITSVLLWIFDRYSPYSYQNNIEKYKDDEEKRVFSLRESLWFCMTSLTPQGGGEAPKNLSGRLVAATWWLFGFIIIASYTANLAAFLTVSRLETPIESLDDLSKQYKVNYAPVNGSATMIYFKRMAAIEEKFYEIWKDMSLNDSLSEIERSKLAVWDYPVSDRYTKIWQAMQETGFPSSIEEAIGKVRLSKSATDGFAFIGDATDIKYYQLITCDLVSVGEEFSKKPYALALQQGSPLKEKLNTAILELVNQRKLEELRLKWWDHNPEAKKCPLPEDPSDGISVANIGGVFIVILVGIGLAIVILCIEYFFYSKQKQDKVELVRGIPSSSRSPLEIFDGNQMTLRNRARMPNAGFNKMYPPEK